MAVGAIGNSLVPGVGCIVGQVVGDQIGRHIKDGHTATYGAHASRNATTARGRFIARAGRKIGKSGFCFCDNCRCCNGYALKAAEAENATASPSIL